ncbi:MAG: hypothetical protein ACK4E0_07010 [Chitinophagaceae bacterium]
MKTVQLTLLLAILSVIVSSCEKDSKSDNEVPGQIDLTNVSLTNSNRNFVAKGITFSGANGYDGGQWQNCVNPDGAQIRVNNTSGGYNGIELAYTDFNTLIADVSDLPPISRVTVKFFNNCCPTLSVCGPNGVIASTQNASNQGANATMVLNFDQQQVEKVSFQSLESIVASITIE